MDGDTFRRVDGLDVPPGRPLLLAVPGLIDGLRVLAASNLDHLGPASRDHGYLNSRGIELLDSLTIADMKHFQSFAPRPEVEMSVSHRAIHIQHKQTNGRGVLSFQTTPARKRSCMFNAPIKRCS